MKRNNETWCHFLYEKKWIYRFVCKLKMAFRVKIIESSEFVLYTCKILLKSSTFYMHRQVDMDLKDLLKAWKLFFLSLHKQISMGKPRNLKNVWHHCFCKYICIWLYNNCTLTVKKYFKTYFKQNWLMNETN